MLADLICPSRRVSCRYVAAFGGYISRHCIDISESRKFELDRSDETNSAINEGDEIRALRKLERDNPDSPFVFCSERHGPFAARTVHAIVAHAGEDAGIKFPVHPHMLRQAKGYQLASKGIDTRAIQGYLGHKNIQHTPCFTPSSIQNVLRASGRTSSD